MNGRRYHLLGVGECMLELRADGALGSAAALDCGYGGDVLNALVAAARIGGRTGFISRVGDDPFGPALLASWRAERVDTAHAPLVAGENGVYFISLLEGGEREFTYRRSGSAASQLAPDDIDGAYLASASCLLVSGITQAISASAQAATLRACELAREHGVNVAYDPNYRERLWMGRGGVAAARAAMHAILPLVDVILPSYPADAALLGQACTSAAAQAAAYGVLCAEVALKCGEQGSATLVNGCYHEVAPVAPLRVLDTTGAGDTWNGVYLMRRINGSAPAAAAASANRAAAAKLAHRGAVPPSKC